ncbi:transcriptional regulator [Corynebacterium silvaticum]|uniref:Transcriptional regulator n=1 Tax=Corynebacterium silvaticum TaxID=2320431 RepID=A0A7Y4LKR9_9CORY|nr:transcriptional regulator [Corynebacterium silvaticum]ARU45182.1 transcriptional regulator [Corynebacterium silvaticum]MBH5301016.1 transcriptional regulator [Corynebacterium silvaticum]NOM65217.1 transcriptional regulator [Corynebacterium silvaticum]NON70852.1 transcriptional regulator [Corynebacterium silvaticum]TFA92771.1 transcriptional regulator [Corynebacterium silvaticum]
MTNTFTSLTERGEGWWVIQLKEDPGLLTQTRRLDQIPDMVRDALGLFPELTDDPENAIVTIEFREGEDIADIANQAVQANQKAKQAQKEASQLMRQAAAELSKKGLSYRDIGTLLGVSFQRAQKLATA